MIEISRFQGRGNYKTFWLTGKDGFDKVLPEPVISDNNHGYERHSKYENLMIYIYFLVLTKSWLN
jgi:hypothetical protein